jgi:hypothetical protein
MLARVLALFALVLAHAPALAQSAIRDSVGFVAGTIDGKGPYWFLVDSGANRSALDSAVARSLGLTVGGKTRVEGTAGTVEVEETRISSLRAVGLDVSDLRPTVQDLSGSLAPEGEKIAGILGLDALRDYAVLFDSGKKRVELSRRAEALASLEGATIVPFELDNGIPRVEVMIEGVPAKLRIDTGAAIGDGPNAFINVTDRLYRQLLERDPGLTPYTHFRAFGTGGEIKVAVVKARRFSIGGTELPEPRLIVQPAVGYFARDDAVGFLGGYAFKAWPGFILDYPNRRLILLRNRSD